MHNYEDVKNPISYVPKVWRQRVAVVGARGYSGLELSRLLLRHPLVQLVGCFATDSSFVLSHYLTETRASEVPTWQLSDLDEHLTNIDALFLATPAEASLELAPKVLAKGVHVIDLSGAFRLRQGDVKQRYKKWYGFEHSETKLLKKAHFGLQPWAKPLTEAKTAQLVANPGCYASAVMMALIPLLQAGLVDPNTLVIDAKSGTSGAGRKAAEGMLFTEVEGECLPYKVGQHQHLPEIIEALEEFSGVAVEPFLTTHLLTVRRGIIASIYAKTSATEDQIEAAFQQAYSHYPLVKMGRLGTPAGDGLLSLKRVVGSARTHLAFRVVGDKLFLFSLIDNLVKGAAGQAVENLNRLMDQPCDMGLSESEGVL
ncbi:MAG: N-acetyl-gamma-glutamyl-phosphate reductase [Bdellovibrionales bacterium]